MKKNAQPWLNLLANNQNMWVRKLMTLWWAIHKKTTFKWNLLTIPKTNAFLCSPTYPNMKLLSSGTCRKNGRQRGAARLVFFFSAISALNAARAHCWDSGDHGFSGIWKNCLLSIKSNVYVCKNVGTIWILWRLLNG